MSRDLPALSAPELFSLYRGILGELKSRDMIRTDNNPAGDYAEFLVKTAVGGVLAANSEKSWDVRASDGEKLQVKCRVLDDPPRPGQLQLSPFRSFDFASAVIVFLSAADYSVIRASKVPCWVIKSAAPYRQHVNGNILIARPEIMGHPDATDLTAILRAAADKQQDKKKPVLLEDLLKARGEKFDPLYLQDMGAVDDYGEGGS